MILHYYNFYRHPKSWRKQIKEHRKKHRGQSELDSKTEATNDFDLFVIKELSDFPEFSNYNIASAFLKELKKIQKVCFNCKNPLDVGQVLLFSILEILEKEAHTFDSETFKKQWKSPYVPYYCYDCLSRIALERGLLCKKCGCKLINVFSEHDSNWLALFRCPKCNAIRMI